ncbi:hypothetical protein VTI28DRAFT_5436 [Corynascus sepedonium]
MRLRHLRYADMLRVLGDMRDLVERYGVPASDKAADHEFPIYKLEIGQVGFVMLYSKGVEGTVARLQQGQQLL